MAFDLNEFKVDDKKELEGIVVHMSPKRWIRVARLGNRLFRDMYQEKMQPYEAAQRSGFLKDEVQEGIIRETAARTILIDWGGFTENGQEVPYSPENAERAMKESQEFFAFVLEQAKEQNNFRPAKSETEKNSSTASTGS
jgi:hypothetical protein